MEYRIAAFHPQIQLSNSIHKFWMDFITLIRDYVITTLFKFGGQESKDAINANLERIAEELRNSLIQSYGDDVADQMKEDFLKLAYYFTQMIEAYAKGDEYAVIQNRNNLYFLANAYAQNYALINRYLNRTAMQTLFYALINSLENQIISLINQDYLRDIEEYKSFVYSGFQLADEFTYGMLRQFYPGYTQ